MSRVWVLMEWDATALQRIKNKIQPQDIVILNGDDELLLREMAGVVCYPVTFGYHLKSTLTISGREEDVTTGTIRYSFSLQRPVQTCKQEIIEPCELKWSASSSCATKWVMAAAAYFLVSEVAFFS